MSLLALAGCGSSSVLDALTAKADERCATRSSCEIDLSEAAKFQWIDAYAFDVGASRDFIERTIGAPFYGDTDLSYVLVFMDGKKVARYETREYEPEPTREKVILFDFFETPRADYYVVHHAKPKLAVAVMREGGRFIYLLSSPPTPQ
jgi:hypothetical protein